MYEGMFVIRLQTPSWQRPKEGAQGQESTESGVKVLQKMVGSTRQTDTSTWVIMNVYATGNGNEGNVMLCLRCRVSAKQVSRTAGQQYNRCDRGVGNECGSISTTRLRSGNGRAQVFVPICRLVWLVTWSHRHRVADSAATPTFRSSFHLAETTSTLPLSSPSHPSPYPLSILHSPFAPLKTGL